MSGDDAARTDLCGAATPDPEGVLLLLRAAFDMLDRNLAEERFCVSMRSAFWDERQAPGARAAAAAVIRMLEFREPAPSNATE